ncbi:MAG TPA: metal-dependent hydrolase, partial [Chitinophagaceae bacterium]|nr:metal-dependent hydrolase [Chitinophagaceae bacterium]
PGGWTVHQLVHHVADSHMNAYTRFKLGYTEATPTIKPYDENAWSQLSDVTTIPINISLTLLHCVHQRLYAFLQHLTVNDW